MKLYNFPFLSFIFKIQLPSQLGLNIPIKYEWFLNRSLWPIDGTLTGSTTPS